LNFNDNIDDKITDHLAKIEELCDSDKSDENAQIDLEDNDSSDVNQNELDKNISGDDIVITERMTIETNLSSIEESNFDDAVTLGLNRIEEIIDNALREMEDNDRLNQSMVSIASSSQTGSVHSGPLTSRSCVS
jgi:glucosamine 6-phosphate synthetase-like amidotransferase/phosphosugar isomerase protein